jgi:hypothetical protein
MKRLPAGRWTPAALVALVALLFGGGAFALAKTSGGGTISACAKKHGGALCVARKCAKRDKKLTWNKVGPAGARGPAGAAGNQGPTGPTGPQGPGAKTLAFDANATAGPTPTVVGTVLGVTIYADCKIPSGLPAGRTELETFLQTSDGSWTAGFGSVTNDNGTDETFSGRADVPAGTLTSPAPAANVIADPATAPTPTKEADEHLDILQTLPQKGHMVWHLSAKTTFDPASQQCHLTIQSFPSS